MSRIRCYPHHIPLLLLLSALVPLAANAQPMCDDFHAGINGGANTLPSAFVSAERSAEVLVADILDNARASSVAGPDASPDLAKVSMYLQAMDDEAAREAAGLHALSPLLAELQQTADGTALRTLVADWQRRGLLDAALGTHSKLGRQPLPEAAARIARLFDALGGNSAAGAQADAFTAARVEVRWTATSAGAQDDAFDRLAAELPVAHLQTWLRWRLLDRFANDLPASLVIHTGHATGTEAQTLAEQVARFRLQGPIGRLFGDRLPQAGARVQRAQALAEEIRSGFILQMADARWLGPEARLEAQRKVARTHFRIGQTDASSAVLPTLDDSDHLANAVTLTQHLARPADATPGVPAWSTRILYHYASNTLLLPLAALQDPLFPLDDDEAAVHGSLGAVIGHELAHAIDARGRTIDAAGSNRNWWSTDDQAAYTRHFAALIGDHNRQQGALRALAGLDENFADLIGVDVAHRVLLSNPATSSLHHEQQFFAGWARLWRGELPHSRDGHAPTRHRVNTPLAHSVAFARAYGCGAGSPMARAEGQRISPWHAEGGRWASIDVIGAGPG